MKASFFPRRLAEDLRNSGFFVSCGSSDEAAITLPALSKRKMPRSRSAVFGARPIVQPRLGEPCIRENGGRSGRAERRNGASGGLQPRVQIVGDMLGKRQLVFHHQAPGFLYMRQRHPAENQDRRRECGGCRQRHLPFNGLGREVHFSAAKFGIGTFIGGVSTRLSRLFLRHNPWRFAHIANGYMLCHANKQGLILVNVW